MWDLHSHTMHKMYIDPPENEYVSSWRCVNEWIIYGFDTVWLTFANVYHNYGCDVLGIGWIADRSSNTGKLWYYSIHKRFNSIETTTCISMRMPQMVNVFENKYLWILTQE